MADNAQVRRENESLLRESLRGGAYSKNELAHRTGLSFPTVGRIVDDMVSSGEAAASGEAASTGGRCATPSRCKAWIFLWLIRISGP